MLHRDEPLYLRAQAFPWPDVRTEEDLIDAVQAHLRELGYSDTPVEGWQHPEREERALAFPGVGDRQGEWCLVHFGVRSVHFHKLPNRQALEERAAALPDISEAFHQAGAPLRKVLGNTERPTFLGFIPERPPNRAERRRARKRRRAA